MPASLLPPRALAGVARLVSLACNTHTRLVSLASRHACLLACASCPLRICSLEGKGENKRAKAERAGGLCCSTCCEAFVAAVALEPFVAAPLLQQLPVLFRGRQGRESEGREGVSVEATRRDMQAMRQGDETAMPVSLPPPLALAPLSYTCCTHRCARVPICMPASLPASLALSALALQRGEEERESGSG